MDSDIVSVSAKIVFCPKILHSRSLTFVTEREYGTQLSF